jgi:trehalose synthase-fused probable maltokinase
MIDTEQLLNDLPDRRWFGGKGRAIGEVQVVDEAVIDDGPPALVAALVKVIFSDGHEDYYNLLLLVSQDGQQRDAFEDVDRLRLIGELMTNGLTIKGDHGAFHFGGPGLDPMSPPGRHSARPLETEQSNSSVILDDDVIVKVFRRVEMGENPDLELNRLLTNEGFDAVPPHVGEILFEGTIDGDDASFDLGIAQKFIHGGAEGWRVALDSVLELYDGVLGLESFDDIDAEIEARSGGLFESFQELGDVTASIHVLFARDGLEPEIASEPIDASDLGSWAGSARNSLSRLLDLNVPGLEEVVPAIEERIERLTAIPEPGYKTRLHGDYHLGQVLHTARGWVVLDFEGEPARSLETRRTKHSPLRDAAGMLRSFSYAAVAGLFERAAPESEKWAALEPWAEAWELAARNRFMSGYLGKVHEARLLPADRDSLGVMLDVFEIDKALYELGYELSHRPDWLRIPLRGIHRVIERGRAR